MFRRCVWVLILGTASVYAAPKKTEARVKAATALNLPLFTTYPKGHAPDQRGVLRVGLIGKHKIADALATFHGKKQGKRSIVVKRYSDPKKARECHVVFVAPSRTLPLKKILAGLGNAPTLVVGDAANFARDGGMIGFRIENKKVRFDFNRRALQDARLKLHPKLLRLGRIVERRKKS